MSATEPNTSLTRTERLDRLPYTRAHTKLLGGSGIGWALDAMDVGLISFILAALATEWNLSGEERGWIASVGFVGMAVGASLGGLLADRIGRRQVFALTLLVYGLATGASAAAGGVAALIALRFLVGLGLGAELPVASTLVSEFAPKKIRGRVVVILEAFWAVGWILAALIGYFVVPLENGWRWAFLIGMAPAAYALYVRWRLPESVRFLERTGRHAEAESAVRSYEASAGIPAPVPERVYHPEQAPDGGPSDAASVTSGEGSPTPPKARWRDLWTARLRRRTLALWVVWFFVNFAYYGAFIWIPSLLVDRGFDLVRSFGYTLIITLAQLPGYAAAAFLIEKWGRRATLATFLAGSAVAALLFGQAESVGTILATGMALSAFNLGAWGALYAVTPELYPTALRGTGAGSAAAFGRIASILAPLAVPFFVAFSGQPFAFAMLGAAFVLACAAALLLPDRTGEALEEE
ncbi:MFS transporter [Ruania alba]|uniref:MFS transporter, putative metabolite:H+ symporter n=1 Tax=Ruania alba TaxID=648782 RepID=A0A1H5LYI3_9MICO|nr:MFS transporter [Ruania alba]SEE81318.1 MFS transporter, putative metabolite:H+ symporter [Ruania alba]